MCAAQNEPVPLLAWNEAAFGLGVPEMDATHRAFVELLNRLHLVPDNSFAPLFTELCEHTRAHFASEEARMRECGFPAIAEHSGEHGRVLGDMERFARQINKGRTAFARAWVRQALPDWFRLHAATMDSALAGHWQHFGHSPN